MTDRELMQQALDALIDAADSQSWEMQQNIDQHGEWYRRSVYLKQATAKSQEAIEALRARLAQPEQEKSRSQKIIDAGFTKRDTLLECDGCGKKFSRFMLPIHACEDAQPEQEPVAQVDYNERGNICWLFGKQVPDKTLLYTAPPQREWQGLTDEEIEKLVYDIRSQTTGVVATAYVARAIEAKLKEKNGTS